MNGWQPPLWFPLGNDGYVAVLAFGVALLTAFLAAFPVRSLAHQLGAVDMPGGRRIHTRPTARLGGIAVLVAVVIGTGFALASAAMPAGAIAERWHTVLPILVLAAGVCMLGAWDDIRSLSPVAKLGGLTVAAILLVIAGVRIEIIEIPGIGRVDLAWLAVPVTLVWVLACTNAMNLIDGVDGAGSGVGMVSSGVLALVALGTGDPVSAVLFAALCGATAGFLFHNRQPASIFLGDSGSLMLGFLLAANSAAGCTKRATALTLTAALLALAVPFLDSTQSFVRRFRRALSSGSGRRRVMSALRATAIADRGHIHHRLLMRGLSHRQVARVLCLVTLVMGLTALLLLPSDGPGLFALVGGVLAGCFMLTRLASLRDSGPAPAPAAAAAEPDVVLPTPQPEPAVVLPAAAAQPRQPQREPELAPAAPAPNESASTEAVSTEPAPLEPR